MFNEPPHFAAAREYTPRHAGEGQSTNTEYVGRHQQTYTYSKNNADRIVGRLQADRIVTWL